MGIEAIDPFELPLINTVILLSSGFTVTYGHHFLINGKRSKALYGLLYTVILATIFTGLLSIAIKVQHAFEAVSHRLRERRLGPDKWDDPVPCTSP
jgi:heme/copper-type cytochrome/quinol oxidase subunit 3